MVVQRERLYEQDGAAGFEVLPRVPGGASRVAHVVQAVEEADEVVAAGVLRGRRDLEAGPPGHPGLGGPLACGLIEGRWKSKPQNRGAWGRLRP